MTTNNKDITEKNIWEYTSQARKRIEKWPEWKKNIKVTKYFATSNRDTKSNQSSETD